MNHFRHHADSGLAGLVGQALHMPFALLHGGVWMAREIFHAAVWGDFNRHRHGCPICSPYAAHQVSHEYCVSCKPPTYDCGCCR